MATDCRNPLASNFWPVIMDFFDQAKRNPEHDGETLDGPDFPELPETPLIPGSPVGKALVPTEQAETRLMKQAVPTRRMKGRNGTIIIIHNCTVARNDVVQALFLNDDYAKTPSYV